MSAAAQNTANEIKAKIAKMPLFADWRRLAALYESNAQWELAAWALRSEAKMYRAKNSLDAALIKETKAANLETQIGFYYRRQPTQRELALLYKGASAEPFIGAYRGAFIDRDDQLGGKYFDENWQTHRSIEQFEKLTGHEHASYFMYISYGQKFPTKWIEDCKKHNVIPHLAWEPRSMNQVRDDAYLQGWGKELRKLDWPVFIRFAGEMNGNWTPYHRDAKLYRERFALLHRVLHRYAPRVATIWCIGALLQGDVMQWYPGDDGCDWVGINLYSVPFSDNDKSRPAFKNSPLTLIDPYYKMFAARKPIAICEFASSHMAKADMVLRNDFSIDKMLQLYSALPILYPRIKLVDWFSMNAIAHAKAGRGLSNYNLTEQAPVLAAYKRVHDDEYFLGAPVQTVNKIPHFPRGLAPNQSISLKETGGSLRLNLWIKTYLDRPKVYFRWNDRIVYASRRPGAHDVGLDLKDARGKQVFTVFVYDDKNRFIAWKQTAINVVA